ncbi:hypothetical protein H5410_007925 [Solanum commersonii]|uniref:Uncharacterized protein n=1 Tax=Solanum commersonii TaxID=4109 RepID=A0A9J6AEA1_SOLCO|nr:hypothetical protein H5410_007925 [Solanum commersonii]
MCLRSLKNNDNSHLFSLHVKASYTLHPLLSMDKLMQLLGFNERAIQQVEVCDCCKKKQLTRLVLYLKMVAQPSISDVSFTINLCLHPPHFSCEPRQQHLPPVTGVSVFQNPSRNKMDNTSNSVLSNLISHPAVLI